MSLALLAEMSNRYGRDGRYVKAGGGNTSYKERNRLFIKGSGVALATIRPEDFVVIDRQKLQNVWEKDYPLDPSAREAEALADLMDARVPGETRRPSVETLLHDALPYRFVCHLHPTAINGLTCAANGEETASLLFPDAAWVPPIMPGYVLAAAMRKAIAAALQTAGKAPQIVFLQNHGVFVAADTVPEIDAIYEHLLAAVENAASQKPDFTPVAFDQAAAAAFAPALRALCGGGFVLFETNRELQTLTQSDAAFSEFRLDLSPDHIVYCRQTPLFVPGETPEALLQNLRGAITGYRVAEGGAPNVVAAQGLGLFACAPTAKEARCARDLMLDAAAVAAYARSFGGRQPMPEALVSAIAGWEVERYRKSVNASSAPKRMQGKIALVTGAAQGFGLGLAEGLCREGACVALADMNFPGAEKAAGELCAQYGPDAAFPIEANVADEASVKNMIERCTLRFGGLDLLVSNAGIVRAGSLEEMTLQNFRLCTDVNYTGFFLCAKYASVPMKIQRQIDPAYTADILQINSKSGLTGSKKNFAYAGGKFGGIGLVQSFALELCPFGIKVNAVCPGNFLDGPLWTDPEKGLFVQYLKAGKVPGAKTVQDVRAHYEELVPMGRGCRVEDVLRAVLYLVEQQYETGQALPVTGGQTMLH